MRPSPLTTPGSKSGHLASALRRTDSRPRIALLQSLVGINQSHNRMTKGIRSNHLLRCPARHCCGARRGTVAVPGTRLLRCPARDCCGARHGTIAVPGAARHAPGFDEAWVLPPWRATRLCACCDAPASLRGLGLARLWRCRCLVMWSAEPPARWPPSFDAFAGVARAPNPDKSSGEFLAQSDVPTGAGRRWAVVEPEWARIAPDGRASLRLLGTPAMPRRAGDL